MINVNQKSMKIIIVIPARMESSRLPGKPLIDINGKSLIQRTYNQCLKAFSKERVYVATDDDKIVNHCKDNNMQVIMTSSDCLTGTDRVAEVAEQVEADYYINVQGDEPLMNPKDILDTEAAIQKFEGEVINGYAKIEEEDLYKSLTIPKLVFRPDGRLLYMSRHSIPGNKAGKFEQSWRQICVYAYPKSALQDFVAHGKKTPLESMEDLEILRFLELGYEVRMIPLSSDSIAVDVPEDVERVLEKLKEIE
jgi:3-deoxy-manno-octulosonate cytidylyltransferase (CMP-KDO synthetase)